MKTKFYLVINNKGQVKTTKTQPGLHWNEISVAMNITLPDMLFKKPSFEANIIIPESAASPKEISVEMQDNILEAIQQTIGMDIKLLIENKQP